MPGQEQKVTPRDVPVGTRAVAPGALSCGTYNSPSTAWQFRGRRPLLSQPHLQEVQCLGPSGKSQHKLRPSHAPLAPRRSCNTRLPTLPRTGTSASRLPRTALLPPRRPRRLPRRLSRPSRRRCRWGGGLQAERGRAGPDEQRGQRQGGMTSRWAAKRGRPLPVCRLRSASLPPRSNAATTKPAPRQGCSSRGTPAGHAGRGRGGRRRAQVAGRTAGGGQEGGG